MSAIKVCFGDGTKLNMHSGGEALAAARLAHRNERVSFEPDEAGQMELRRAIDAKVIRDLETDPLAFGHGMG